MSVRKPFNYRDYLPKIAQRLFGNHRSHVYGSARWMDAKTMQRLYSPEKNSGFILSEDFRMSDQDSFCNTLVCGPTGKGKTSLLVMRNILDCADDASIVVTDIKGSIFRATSGYMKKRGFNVQVVQPDDLEHSVSFNPLSYFSTPDELLRFTQLLFPSDPLSSNFWTDAPRLLSYLCLFALSNIDSGRYLTIENLRRLLNKFMADQDQLEQFMQRNLGEDIFLYEEFRSLIGSDRETLSNILLSAKAMLNPWLVPNIRKFTATNTLDLSSLRQRPTIIYVIVPVEKQRYYSKILNLFYGTCFEHCMRHSGRDVHFFLDEFGNLGKIEDFERFCTTTREYRISLNLFVQDYSQIEKLYGVKDAETIIRGGMQSKIFMGGLDISVTRQVEERLGHTTQYDNEYNGVDQYSRSVKVPLLPAWEICQLADNEIIHIYGSRQPSPIRITPYYQDARLANHAKLPAVDFSPTRLVQAPPKLAMVT